MNSKNKLKQTKIGMIPEDWDIKNLRDSCTVIQYGYTQSATLQPIGPNFLRGTDIRSGTINWDTVPYCKISETDLCRYLLKKDDILITRMGTPGDSAFLDKEIVAVFASYLIRIRLNETFYPKFIYYFLQSGRYRKYISSIVSTSATPGVNAKNLTNVEVPRPPIDEQRAIAKILSDLDAKIELNRQTNSTLEQVGQALFKRWFVDFEFPDENGRPYKSSGGEMVDSELGEIPKEWKVGGLGDIIENFDSKRVPLSSRERASKKGAYPYYGAASILDYVEDYIFDGIYVLVGEDGTVIDENEHPMLQYVWGKFWVNNHAHVIQGKAGFITEYVLLLLKQTNVRHAITGAVQPKINQENLNHLKVIVPTKEILATFSNLINPIFERYRVASEETTFLAKTRDALLPKLMSGEIRVLAEEWQDNDKTGK